MQAKITSGQTPPKWHQKYPQGTTVGNEEYKFFISLARHPKYSWRSVASIAKESGLSKKRVEEILQKYYKLGMVFQSEKTEDNWAYWERVPELLTPASVTVAAKDQGKRIAKAKKTLGSGGSNAGPQGPQGSAGLGMPATQDDDDDDTACRVRPMQMIGRVGMTNSNPGAKLHVQGHPAGPAKMAFLKLEDEKCVGNVSKEDVAYAITLLKGDPQFCYSTSIYSEGELADIDHLKKIASEASSETLRARANAALEARGFAQSQWDTKRWTYTVDLPSDTDREAFIQRLKTRFNESRQAGHVQVAQGFELPASCEFGRLEEAEKAPAKVSLKDLLAGAPSVENVTKRSA
jgi:hypothetical protein